MKRKVYNNTLPDVLEKMDAKWAMGCDNCSYGLVSPPAIPSVAASLYMVRLVQATNHDLTFCDCQAGTSYRVSLLNRRQKLIEEARKDPRMIEYAKCSTHPDLESCREAMALVAPTVHGVPEPPRERVPA